MDRVIFGDNQFFGVNHRSEEKAIASLQRFAKNEAIIEVLDGALECGINAFSFSTHDRVAQICDHFRAHPQDYRDVRLYPCLPYAHKYADLVAEKGVFGAIVESVASNNPASRAAGMILTGAQALLKRDMLAAMDVLVDAEMKMFQGLNVKVVFLQNIVTDLIYGLGWKEPLVKFHAYIREQYGAEAGFMSLNLPKMVDFLHECGIEDPLVCSPINKIGFQMNPDVPSYEDALEKKKFRAVAMSVLAAGAIPPEEAIKYVAERRNIRSVLFGASSKAHIRGTKDMIDSYFNNAA